MKAFISLAAGLLLCLSSFSQLKAYFTYGTFFSPESGPYIETYLSVIGNSVKYQKTASGKFQGSIEITIVFKQGEEIKNFKKYNLLSPELNDTLNSFVNFIDQQRFLLPSANYTLELDISDVNSPVQPFKSIQQVSIDFSKEKISISDVELIESYSQTTQPGMLSKSGYDLVPYVSNFLPASINKISFYAELYNTDIILGKDEKYLVNYFIETYETSKALNNFRGFLRQNSKPVNVILSSMNISNLPSGNYNLVLEIRNKNNMLLTNKKMFFQRSNPEFKIKAEDISSLNPAGTFAENLTNKDTLAEFIRALAPIASESETRFIENNFPEKSIPDLALMQKFFLSFWIERNSNDPGQEWDNYRKQVAQVNKSYGTRIRKGYETDRGRIYLKYGKPNSIIDQSFQDANYYPYQIWHYYKTDRKNNAKFVFYNTDLVTNDYQILHSNVLGEANDYRWQYRLKQRSTSGADLDKARGDVTDIDENKYDSRLDDYWNSPR